MRRYQVATNIRTDAINSTYMYGGDASVVVAPNKFTQNVLLAAADTSTSTCI